MNSSPASSCARPSSSSIRSLEARRDLPHAVRVDANAGVLHPRQHARQRQLDVLVERDEIALGKPGAHERGEAKRQRRAADERRRLLLGRRHRVERDPVLRGEVGEIVSRAPRLDQVRGEERVVDRIYAERLRVVSRDLAFDALGAWRNHDLVRQRNGTATVINGVAERPRRLGKLAFAPRQLLSRYDGPLGRGQRLVQLVDALHERAELEAPEHLLELGAVGRREHELSRVAVDVEIAAHRRQHFRLAGLVGVLAERLRAAGRQLVDVLEHALHRVELLDELRCGLVADARHAGDRVGRVALEADQVGHLLGRHAETRGDALRRIDVDVGDAARRHHQADVVRDELECVAVGGDDARGARPPRRPG